ncbi:MAG: 1-phosphofructokinase family hexose kinase [Nocardioidaceae bacterium]
MILTVTCNPAIDVTYRVDSLVPGEMHRVREVTERAGGKGVNVARVLHLLGEQTLATGLADVGFADAVEELGVPAAFVTALPSLRRTLVVHTDRETTSLWEPGAVVEEPAEAALKLERHVQLLLTGADGLVVAGSLPPGFAPDLPTRLAELAIDEDVPVVLDLDDEPLRVAADGGAAVLMPNRDELARLVAAEGDLDVVAAARELSGRSRASVVATLGVDGMVAVTKDGSWHAVAEQVAGNPTGAGDAAAAAVIRGLVRSEPWPEVLADAVALSAAAVVAPVAGEVDLAAYHQWRGTIEVRPIDSLIVQQVPR